MSGAGAAPAPRALHVDNGGVEMTIRREMRLRHASDTAHDMGVVFGGDTMGHWNVDRINRTLDALDAPVRHLQIPRENMRGMAAVGAPDMIRVGRYVQMGRSSMPPLTFVALDEADQLSAGTVRTLLVDGHHRMMALALMNAPAVPCRVLPRELEHDVRVVEIGQVAIFPERQLPTNEVDLGRWQA